MNEVISVDVHIVNYNTKDYLRTCLDSLVSIVDLSEVNVLIRVIDNDSSDDLRDLEADFPEVDFTKSLSNVGFGAAHNQLISLSRADFIFIVNPDVAFIQRDTITNLLKEAQGASIGIVGPKLVDVHGNGQVYDHARLKGMRAKVALLAGESYYKESDVSLDVAWVSGAAMLVKKDVFERVGMFDPKFFLYKEEEDLCLRAREEGFRVRYCGDIKARHVGSVVASPSEHLATSKEYFTAKHLKGRKVTKYASWLNHFLNTVGYGSHN